MDGLSAGTLVLTKRIERFQALHATLLLIGGVRRVPPQFCRVAINSFPLHTFYTDTLGVTMGLDASGVGFIDIVKEAYSTDTLEISASFDCVFLETLLQYSHEDSLSVSMGALNAVFIDSLKVYDAGADSVSVTMAFADSNTMLIDNVIQLNSEESVGISVGNFVASFEDL